MCDAQAVRNFRTKICKHFEAGSCQKGSGCNFAHGSRRVKPHRGQDRAKAQAKAGVRRKPDAQGVQAAQQLQASGSGGQVSCSPLQTQMHFVQSKVSASRPLDFQSKELRQAAIARRSSDSTAASDSSTASDAGAAAAIHMPAGFGRGIHSRFAVTTSGHRVAFLVAGRDDRIRDLTDFGHLSCDSSSSGSSSSSRSTSVSSFCSEIPEVKQERGRPPSRSELQEHVERRGFSSSGSSSRSTSMSSSEDAALFPASRTTPSDDVVRSSRSTLDTLVLESTGPANEHMCESPLPMNKDKVLFDLDDVTVRSTFLHFDFAQARASRRSRSA